MSELLFTVLYADDASVVILGKYMFSIMTTFNHELYKISAFLKSNKLSLDTVKIYLICCVASWGNAPKCIFFKNKE